MRLRSLRRASIIGVLRLVTTEMSIYQPLKSYHCKSELTQHMPFHRTYNFRRNLIAEMI
jgi:hypothetical protein